MYSKDIKAERWIWNLTGNILSQLTFKVDLKPLDPVCQCSQSSTRAGSWLVIGVIKRNSDGSLPNANLTSRILMLSTMRAVENQMVVGVTQSAMVESGLLIEP